MKNFVSYYKKLFLLSVFLIGFTALLFSYQNGDYRSKQEGSWFSTSTWEVYNNGQWIPASTIPSYDSNGTIYIKNYVWIEHSIQVFKNLVIENSGFLMSYPYQEIPITIQFLGELINVNGMLGDQQGETVTLKMLPNENPNQRLIGSGYLKLAKLYVYSNVYFTANANIKLLRVFENATVESKYHQKSIWDLQICNENAKFKIYSEVYIEYRVMVGAGNNFSEAPELYIGPAGTLSLPSNDSYGYAALRLGYHDQYAKLTLEGNTRRKAVITANNNAHWSIMYPSQYSDGHKIQIKASNAIFEKMNESGLVIRSRVKIVDNKFVRCIFRDSYGRIPVLLDVLRGRGVPPLKIYNSVFENNRGYNIKYISSLGNVYVYNATGNLAGEQYDYDPYNSVLWHNYKGEKSNDNSNILNISLDNYPNPFNPTTTISYQLAKKSEVSLAIYNMKGEKIKTLIDKTQEEGKHAVVWNGLNDKNEKVPSGVYFYKLKIGDSVIMKKMTLLK